MFTDERSEAFLMGKFKPGDLVKIKDTTHQDNMPEHRIAMIVEDGEMSESYSGPYTVIFLGTDLQLKFHEMFLEAFTSA
tara:strand:+ start:88 stop:324 length:237 start_codon:yes stop_codon:yes gene_type:complete